MNADLLARLRQSEKLRRQLVRALDSRGFIRSTRVRDAFLSVPRELFVAEFAGREGLEAVYRDEAILTKRNAQGAPLSSSSQPAIMALMLEQLGLEEGMSVLEIGAGTGYNAALLSVLVGPRGRVVTVDVDSELVRSARVASELAVIGRVWLSGTDGRASRIWRRTTGSSSRRAQTRSLVLGSNN